MVVDTPGDATKLMFALRQFSGLGAKASVIVARNYRSAEALRSDDPERRLAKLGRRFSALLDAVGDEEWVEALSYADEQIDRHLQKSILPIAIEDPIYPTLLGLIPDPPPLLFVKGEHDVLSEPDTVAIVGTRQATEPGLETARELAAQFAERGFVVVSGLALGIDTAGHEGALEKGKTIAVLATPLDKIYPASNRDLAMQIHSSGALVSEYPLGTPTSRWAFVERNRIQSGMSIGVIPIQTDIEGGTMHTVGFAEKQGRLVICPEPPIGEEDLSAYRGVAELLRSDRAEAIQPDAIDALVENLRTHGERITRQEGQAAEEGDKHDSDEFSQSTFFPTDGTQ